MVIYLTDTLIFVSSLFKVKGLARDIYEKYFKAAQTQPRGVVAKLGNIVAQIERACQKQVIHVYKIYIGIINALVPRFLLNHLLFCCHVCVLTFNPPRKP